MTALPCSLILCGFTASGKSAVGSRLADELIVPFYDTDQMLEEKHGMSPQALFAKHGDAVFRDLEHEVALEAAALPPCVISTGGGMLTYPRNAEVLKACGKIILIDRAFDRIWQCLSSQPDRPLLRGRTKENVRAMYDTRMLAYLAWADIYAHNYNLPMTARRLAAWAKTLAAPES